MSKFVLKDRVQDAACYPTVGAVSLILRTTVGCRGQSRKAPVLTTARTASPGVGRPFLYLPWPGKCGPEKGKACFSALYDRVFADWSQRLILPGPALAGASDQRGLVFLGGIRYFPPAPPVIVHGPLSLISVSYLLLNASKQFEGKKNHGAEKRQKNFLKKRTGYT